MHLCATAFILDCSPWQSAVTELCEAVSFWRCDVIGDSNFRCLIFVTAKMEISKSGSSKLIVMTALEPKDELDEVKFSSFVLAIFAKIN